MSLDLETLLKTWLASAPQNAHEIHTLQISHSSMTKTYYLWREPYAGTVTTESGVVSVECMHFEFKPAGAEGHLDRLYEITIDTTDIEDEFREQLDLIAIDTTEKVQIIYRGYLSDDLTDIVAGPITLEAESLSFQLGAAKIIAVLPRLNNLRTGELYVPRDIPMLRGFV